MRQLLREFVDWMEQAYQEGRVGSPFEQAVTPRRLKWAEAALELALATGRPVILFTRSLPLRALVAGVVFKRAGVDIANVFRGDLSDEAFEKLTECLARMKNANIMFETGQFPKREQIVAAADAGKFVLVC